MSFSNSQNPKNNIDVDKITKLLKKLKTYGIKKISYSGGEPLLIDNLNNILEVGKGLKFNQIVTTNGTIPIHVKLKKELIEYTKISIWGDLDFYSKHFHHSIYHKIISTIQFSLNEHYIIGLNIIVTSELFPKLEEFLEYLFCKFPKLDNMVIHGYLPINNNDKWILKDFEKKEILKII